MERRAADHIQILTLIGYTLNSYYSQVNAKMRSTLRRFSICPTTPEPSVRCCGARSVRSSSAIIIEALLMRKGTYYKAFAHSAIFMQSKGVCAFDKTRRTFSLLPLPACALYRSIRFPFIISCLKKVFGEDNSVKELLDYLAGLETAEYIDISTSTFSRVLRPLSLPV